MKRSLRYMLAVAFLVAITVVTASAMAFTGHDASATRPSESPKVRTPAALAEQVRLDRRESFSDTGCSWHMLLITPDV